MPFDGDFSIEDFATATPGDAPSKDELKDELDELVDELYELEHVLYADGRCDRPRRPRLLPLGSMRARGHPGVCH